MFAAVFVAVVLADQRPYSGRSEESEESAEPASYNFEWRVSDEDSDNHFGHQEEREDENTKGSYTVDLPDGRRQTVTYYVDGDSGYVAQVHYSGEAEFPSHETESSEER